MPGASCPWSEESKKAEGGVGLALCCWGCRGSLPALRMLRCVRITPSCHMISSAHTSCAQDGLGRPCSLFIMSPLPNRSGGVSVMQSEPSTYGIPYLAPHATQVKKKNDHPTRSSKRKGYARHMTWLESSVGARFENKRQFIRLLRPCALVAACVHLSTKAVRRVSGVFRDKNKCVQDPTVVSKREKQVQWYQSKQNVGREQRANTSMPHKTVIHAKRVTRVGRDARRSVNARGYVEKFDPNVTAESCQRSKALSGGIGLVVRSNKGVTVSLLFRHSVVAVVEADVFPPDLTQL